MSSHVAMVNMPTSVTSGRVVDVQNARSGCRVWTTRRETRTTHRDFWLVHRSELLPPLDIYASDTTRKIPVAGEGGGDLGTGRRDPLPITMHIVIV
jgi:hypothetical protein